MTSSKRPKALPALGASPAGLKVHFSPYLKLDRPFAIHIGTIALFPICAIIFEQPVMVLVGLILFGFSWARFRKISSYFVEAEPHAAKVISIDPPLVAYYGDLAKATLEPQPVIVILPVNFSDLPQPPETGVRIALVALPKGGDIKRFDHFDARLVSSVISDPAVIDSVLDSIPEWLWEELDDSLFDVPHPYLSGAYAAGLIKI